MFDSATDQGPTDRDFAVRYNAGRAMCPATSRAARACWALRELDHSPLYWEGWTWALWDYEDANGLPHNARL